MRKHLTAQRGLTLIELIIVCALIALLMSIALSAFGKARSDARDTRRLSEIDSVREALELHYIAYSTYPQADMDGCGWDVGNATRPFFNGRGMNSYFAGNTPPVDVFQFDDCSGYRYFFYPAGSYGCPAARGGFYVLGITDVEGTGSPHPDSPGWSCPGRDWQLEFDWVTGEFEG